MTQDLLTSYEQQLRAAHRRHAGRARAPRRLLRPALALAAVAAAAVLIAVFAGNGAPPDERDATPAGEPTPALSLLTSPPSAADRAFWPDAPAIPGADRTKIRLAYKERGFAVYTTIAQGDLCATFANLRTGRAESPCPVGREPISVTRPFHFGVQGHELLVLPDSVRRVIVDTPADARLTRPVRRNMFAFRSDLVDNVYWRVDGQLYRLRGDFGEPVGRLPMLG